jgi:hypothetical protein
MDGFTGFQPPLATLVYPLQLGRSLFESALVFIGAKFRENLADLSIQKCPTRYPYPRSTIRLRPSEKTGINDSG